MSTVEQQSTLTKANAALRANDFARAMSLYIQALRETPELSSNIRFNMETVARSYRANRNNAEQLHVAVCGWELSHNPAGRVYTLAKIYERFAHVEIIGCIFAAWGRRIWYPIRDTDINIHHVLIEDSSDFFRQLIGLVAKHPYDIVHLSKPRAPNILIGLLYKIMWGAKVLVDIDDEELTIVRADSSVSIEEYLTEHSDLPDLSDLPGLEWTRLAVGLVNEFDGITVSNEQLRERYGGEIIYHARDERTFCPSEQLKIESRERFGIAQDKQVVLFCGTGRKHKGLVEIAQTIAALDRDDTVFVLAGDMKEPGLIEKLQSVPNCKLCFIDMQNFDAIASVVAMADICILSQDIESPISKFQLPAKLTDALAMQVVVLANSTPPLQKFIDDGVVHDIGGNLSIALAEVLSDAQKFAAKANSGRALFQNLLSVEVNAHKLEYVVNAANNGSVSFEQHISSRFGEFPFY